MRFARFILETLGKMSAWGMVGNCGPVASTATPSLRDHSSGRYRAPFGARLRSRHANSHPGAGIQEVRSSAREACRNSQCRCRTPPSLSVCSGETMPNLCQTQSDRQIDPLRISVVEFPDALEGLEPRRIATHIAGLTVTVGTGTGRLVNRSGLQGVLDNTSTTRRLSRS